MNLKHNYWLVTMHFMNAAAFNDPNSRLLALGATLTPTSAITDARGNVIAYVRTGGVMSPARYDLRAGQMIYRFGGFGGSWRQVAAGRWWVGRAELEKILAFANAHGLGIGMGVRCLCLVPPEWSDISTLVRARVKRDLVAWRGLGNTVVTQAKGGGVVNMPHQNEIAARRCHQLFIPGLEESGMAASALSVENCYSLDPEDSKRGFLYL